MPDILNEEPTIDVDVLADYFKKIADSLKTQSVSLKGRNGAMSDMYKTYYYRFNHLEAQARLNRGERLTEDLKTNADDHMIEFIKDQLSEDEFKFVASVFEKLGLPI